MIRAARIAVILGVAGLAATAEAKPGKAVPHRAMHGRAQPTKARTNKYAVEPPEVEKAAAFRYAALGEDACLDALRDRGVPFQRVAPPPAVPVWPKPLYPRGVETPLRITGPIWGVTFRPAYRPLPEDQVLDTVADCRLALGLDDLARVLRQYGVVEARYLSMYRPGWTKPGVRHPAGRAIDLASVGFADGSAYSVSEDFHGRIGGQTCGEGATKPVRDTPGARFWRRVVCDLDRARAFNLVLSPHYDRGHRDHLHLEVRSGIRWFLVQ